MDSGLPLFPEQASTMAPRVDALYLFLWSISGFSTILIATLIVVFAIRYRKAAVVDRTPFRSSALLETIWIAAPLVILMVMFVWGAKLYFALQRPPAGCTEFTVVGKQWMWKFQHPQGRREINNLHVPTGTPIRLTMISQDVIHSLYVPAFRIKQDVLPGRYTTMWFEATKVGQYHLFCAEYCGTNHSRMTGTVHVMTPADYQAWLEGSVRGEPPELAGRRLFERFRCTSCHEQQGATPRGPLLADVFGRPVPLVGGGTVVADESYIRESILRPQARVVAGFQPIMPSYSGQLDEDALLELMAYVKSLTKITETTP